MKTTHFTRALLLTICIAGGFSAFAQSRDEASNWPQWRGPQSRGVSEEKNLPDEWSPDKNIIWKTAIPGRGHSSPVVWGNRVFLTTSIEGDVIPGAKAVQHVRNGQIWVHPDAVAGNRKHTLNVLCLDRDSGKILWERVAYEGTVYDDRHRKNTYASPTPVTDGKYVYSFFEAEGLYCHDFNGKLIWKTSLGKLSKVGMGPGTSPTLYENLLFLQCDNEDGGPGLSFIAAVDKRTGKEVWRVKRDHRKTHATPLIVRAEKRVELITSGSESIISYDPKTGNELWRCDGIKGYGIPSPVAGHGMVFLAAGYPHKRAVGVKLGGTGDLTGTPNVIWSYEKGTAYVTSPILYGDYYYLVSDKGILTCVEARTGEIKYEGGRVPEPASFSASAVAFDGKIFLTSEDGDTFVIKAGPTHEVIRTNSLGEVILASPAISQGRIFIRGAKHLYCIGESAKQPDKLTTK
ncbi:MAG: PQQ-binding-like beta-propeller repeat protein [Blastocatellales bacterium]